MSQLRVIILVTTIIIMCWQSPLIFRPELTAATIICVVTASTVALPPTAYFVGYAISSASVGSQREPSYAPL